jgi:hypothetical protein
MFGKTPIPNRTVFVNLPERAGARMDMSELRAALEGHKNNPAVRAILQLMHYRKVNCTSNAVGAAYRNEPAVFDLGGAQAMDELFGELSALVDGVPVPDDLTRWFDSPAV